MVDDLTVTYVGFYNFRHFIGCQFQTPYIDVLLNAFSVSRFRNIIETRKAPKYFFFKI